MSLLYRRIGHTRHVKCWTHHSHVWAIRRARNESRALHARESHNKWLENADFLTPRGQWTSVLGVPLGFRFVAHTKVRSSFDKDTWNTATRKPYLMRVHYTARVISESKNDCFLGSLRGRYWWCLALLWIFSPIVHQSIMWCSIYLTLEQDVSMLYESFIYDTLAIYSVLFI